MEPTPPTTIPTKRLMERVKVKLSGATNSTTAAESEPAMPVMMALTAKVRVLMLARSMPIASAAVGLSRTAIMARPMRPRSKLAVNR